MNNEQVTKKGDLAATRERLRDLAQRFPQHVEEVRQAAEEVERAKLDADLRPKDRIAREAAGHASRRLDTAILERDTLVESIERLRRHESALAAEVAKFNQVDLAASMATFRDALKREIRAEAASVRRFAALVHLESELVGRQVGDLGHLLVEYFSGEFRHSEMDSDNGLDTVRALVASLRERYEQGEVAP